MKKKLWDSSYGGGGGGGCERLVWVEGIFEWIYRL